MGAILTSLGQLAGLAAEYESATEERRRAILDEAERAYRLYKENLASLPAALAANDAAADAAATALPAAPAPPPVAPASTSAGGPR
jgi:hypothetical protein